MYIKKINPYSLTYGDIDKKVIRVKVLIFNSESKILLCNVEGKYTFIGGHVEENETLTMALIRELREETGIVLDNKDLSDYITVKKYYDALFQFLNNNNINYKILDKELYVNINDEEYKLDYKVKKKVI